MLSLTAQIVGAAGSGGQAKFPLLLLCHNIHSQITFFFFISDTKAGSMYQILLSCYYYVTAHYVRMFIPVGLEALAWSKSPWDVAT